MEAAENLYYHPVEVLDRLNGHNLTPNDLWEPLRFGRAYAAECTSHDPPYLKGLLASGKVTRGLRDQLVPQEWTLDNDMNYPLTVHPEHRMAIAVAAGDERTGLPSSIPPKTRSPKGPATERAINVNQLSFADMDPTWQRRPTWILLYNFDTDPGHIRAELSLPDMMTEGGYVSEWQERIILVDDDSSPGVTPSSVLDYPEIPGEVDVPVERKKSA